MVTALDMGPAPALPARRIAKRRSGNVTAAPFRPTCENAFLKALHRPGT